MAWARGILLAVGLASVASASAEITCCVIGGKRVCGSPPPMVCLDKTRVVIEKSGSKREIEAPPSAEERARREAEETLRQKAQAEAEAQRRRDQALLASYASVEEIDRQRERRLSEQRRTLDQAKERLETALAAQKRETQEKAALGGKPAPPELAKRIADTEAEIVAQREIIRRTENELAATQRRFNEDKARFLELKNAGLVR